MTQIPNAPIPQLPMLQCYQLPIVMSDDDLDTFCLREETVFLYQSMKKWHSENERIKMEGIEMTNPMSKPTPMSIIMTTTVPEEMNNITIAVASPSNVGTTSKMQSTLSMNTTTDLSVTQEMVCTFKAFAREKELMVDWKRTKSSHVWNNIVLIDCVKLKVVIKKAMSEDNNTEVMNDEFCEIIPTK